MSKLEEIVGRSRKQLYLYLRVSIKEIKKLLFQIT